MKIVFPDSLTEGFRESYWTSADAAEIDFNREAERIDISSLFVNLQEGEAVILPYTDATPETIGEILAMEAGIYIWYPGFGDIYGGFLVLRGGVRPTRYTPHYTCYTEVTRE